MNVTINEKLIKLIARNNLNNLLYEHQDVTTVKASDLANTDLKGKVLISDARLEDLETLVKILEIRKLKKLDTVFFIVDDVAEAKIFLKSLFKIVKAAGGLVLKEGKVLMIYRLGKWDLPKGKLNRNEKTKIAAEREIEEECSITVEVHEKLCTTWHAFVLDGSWALKKTTWFKMRCINDTYMQPQREEGIEDIRWMDKEQLEKALKNTYRNIKEIITSYVLNNKSKARHHNTPIN